MCKFIMYIQQKNIIKITKQILLEKRMIYKMLWLIIQNVLREINE